MSEPSTNTNRLYALLRKLAKGEGLSENEIAELSNEVFNMSGIYMIDRVGSRLDAMQAKLDMMAESNHTQWVAFKESNQVQLQALRESNQALRESNQATRWLLGIGMTIIGLIVAYGTFFGG